MLDIVDAGCKFTVYVIFKN